MQDKLRDEMAAYFSQHRVCVLSTAGTKGAWAMPVRYRNHGLELDCLLPRWTDVAYYVEQDPRVMVVILDPPSSPLLGGTRGGLRWLQLQGTARPVEEPDWAGLLPEDTPTPSPGLRLSEAKRSGASSGPPGDLYLVIRVTPERMDLFDESQGWGVRETLQL